jgi:hypothetical protein
LKRGLTRLSSGFVVLDARYPRIRSVILKVLTLRND